MLAKNDAANADIREMEDMIETVGFLFCRTYEEFDVTPDLARWLLERNPNNRPVRERGAKNSVAAYAAAMKAGEWKLNGQCIVLSRDGMLNDGQHRLLAVVKADMTVPMGFIFGVDRESQKTVDLGRARTFGNVLGMKGMDNGGRTAAAVKALFSISLGHPPARKSSDLRIAQGEEILAQYPGIVDAAAAVMPLCKQFRLAPAVMAATYFCCQRVDADKAAAFLAMATTGIGIQHETDPAAALRERYIGHNAPAKTRRLKADTQGAFFAKAFRAFCAGKGVGMLKWTDAAPLREPFPVNLDGFTRAL